MFGTVRPKIEYQEISEAMGRFIVEPLESGYGLTLGNSMRRVLLGSLVGAAVTMIKIEGVQHEFSTIPHVMEDTLEFMLNVKGIRFRKLTESAQAARLNLEFEGEGKVHAGDISPSADFEVVNPERLIANLDSPQARLKAELTVEVGKGYVPAGRKDSGSIGVLPMDAVFTPIKSVNYSIEKVRVGELSNFDRLILDVTTDGTITPEDAVMRSARILVQNYSIFLKQEEVAEEAEVCEEEQSVQVERNDMPLDQLGLSSRTLNALRRGGITSAGVLLGKNRDELLDLKNFGHKSWDEVEDCLRAAGLLKEGTMEDGQAVDVEDEDRVATADDVLVEEDSEGDDGQGEEPRKDSESVTEYDFEAMKRALMEKFNVLEEK